MVKDMTELTVDIIIPTVKTEEEIVGLISEIKSTVVYKLNLIIVSGMRSVSVNRNIGMERAKGEFIIMCDDDLERFPPAWDKDLIDALKKTEASMVSPRLLNSDGSLQLTNNRNLDVSKDFVEVGKVITACCVFRNTALRFDENYIGWGYEDTDFCRQIKGKFFIINTVRITHRNEWKNPIGSTEQIDKNRIYYRNKWRVRK